MDEGTRQEARAARAATSGEPGLDALVERLRGGAPNGDVPIERIEMALLGELLQGLEGSDLAALRRRLDDVPARTRDVASVLAEAVAQRGAEDDRLARALRPTIEDAFEDSVRKNPKTLVDAIAPLMGPAIRASIAIALRSMVQGFNGALETSFSVQGLEWRVEAWRSGKSFGDVVLAHSLVYRVEQVFLIHSETSLLLLHEVAPSVEAQDADMVSSMLSAIADFVSDSFAPRSKERLDQVRVGELTVLLERGPKAALAAVVRGSAPESYRAVLSAALEAIHVEHAHDLAGFEGEVAPFEPARLHLEDCMRERFRGAAPGAQRGTQAVSLGWFGALVGGLVLLLSILVIRIAWDRVEWTRALAALADEPGLTLIEVVRPSRLTPWTLFGGTYRVRGLRDPLARDPAAVVAEHDVDAARLAAEWGEYTSLEEEIVARRARLVLAAPAGVKIDFRYEPLAPDQPEASGAHARASRGVLVLTGRAAHRLVVRARSLAGAMPGVDAVDLAALFDYEAAELELVAADVRSSVFVFEAAALVLDHYHVRRIKPLRARVQRLADLADEMRVPIVLEVVGHAAADQGEPTARARSLERALAVRAELGGVGGAWLTVDVKGVGAQLGDSSGPAVGGGTGLALEERRRSVTLGVRVLDASGG